MSIVEVSWSIEYDINEFDLETDSDAAIAAAKMAYSDVRDPAANMWVIRTSGGKVVVDMENPDEPYISSDERAMLEYDVTEKVCYRVEAHSAAEAEAKVMEGSVTPRSSLEYETEEV